MAKKKTNDLPKMPWGQGNFFHHTNDRIGYRKSHTYPSGKKEKKTVYGDTVEECLEKMKILERQLDEEIILSKDLLYDAMIKWLENVKKNRLKPQSYNRYKLIIDNQIKDSLVGHSQYQKLTSQELQSFINSLNKEEYSYSTIQKCFNLLRSFYRYQCAINGTKDPMAIVVLPIKYNVIKEEKEIAWFDEEDIRIFIREATRINSKTKNYVYPNGFIIAANIFLGLRIGELLALTWEDIDLKKNKIYITKTTTQIINPNYNPNDKNSKKNIIIVQDATKTEVKRAVKISKQARELILKHMELHPFENEKDLVICSRNKHILSRSNINQTIKTIQKRGNTSVQGAASHTLRHTCASLLFKNGIPVEVIAKMLGHSPTTCRNIYIGVFEDLIEEAVEKINLDIDFEF